MNKTLLLLATLGSVGVLAGPAAAGDYDRSHLRAPPSFGVRIFVHPAPKVVRHHHRGAWQLRPQPVFRFGDPRPIRQFGHPSPRPLFGHLPPRPHLGHFPPRPHFGHLPPRLHFGHLPPRPRVWHPAPHSSWRQPWQRPPQHAERPHHRQDFLAPRRAAVAFLARARLRRPAVGAPPRRSPGESRVAERARSPPRRARRTPALSGRTRPWRAGCGLPSRGIAP